MINEARNFCELEALGIKKDDVNVFFQQHYKDMMCKPGKAECFYLLSSKYVIPILIYRKYFFIWAQLLSEPYIYNPKAEESEQEFLNEAVSYAKNKLNVGWFSVTPASALFSAYPAGSRRIPFGSYVIDLEKSEEELFAALHSKNRNVVRKADKDGVEVRFGGTGLLADYAIIDEETWRRSGKVSNGENYYKEFIENLGENALVVVSYFEDKPQCGGIFFYNKQMSYYMFGASLNHTHTGAGNLLQWETIKYMKNKGVRKYSFVGCRIMENTESKYHTIQRFKERFGGELIKGFMFKIILKPITYKLFTICLKVLKYKKRYDSDAIDEEIYKWSELQRDN